MSELNDIRVHVNIGGEIWCVTLLNNPFEKIKINDELPNNPKIIDIVHDIKNLRDNYTNKGMQKKIDKLYDKLKEVLCYDLNSNDINTVKEYFFFRMI